MGVAVIASVEAAVAAAVGAAAACAALVAAVTAFGLDAAFAVIVCFTFLRAAVAAAGVSAHISVCASFNFAPDSKRPFRSQYKTLLVLHGLPSGAAAAASLLLLQFWVLRLPRSLLLGVQLPRFPVCDCSRV